MTTDEALQSPGLTVLLGLEAAGFVIATDGPRLRVKPISKLTPEQRADIQRYREAIWTLVDSCEHRTH